MNFAVQPWRPGGSLIEPEEQGVLTERVEISELAFDVLWEIHIGEVSTKPLPLQGPSPGATWGERAEYMRQVSAELAAQGLADDDVADDELVAAVRLLERPEREVYGWAHCSLDEGTSTTGILAATTDDDGVLAVLENGRVRLEPCRTDSMVAAVVNALPAAEPLSDGSFNVPADAFGDDGSIAPGFRGANSAGSGARVSADAARLRGLLEEPRVGAGQLFAARRDRHGRRSRCVSPLSYFDLRRGRFATISKPNPSGEHWLTVLPGSSAALTRQLDELAR